MNSADDDELGRFRAELLAIPRVEDVRIVKNDKDLLLTLWWPQKHDIQIYLPRIAIEKGPTDNLAHLDSGQS